MTPQAAHISGTLCEGEPQTECITNCPKTLWQITSRKLDQLDSILALEELKVPPGNRLEKLSGNRKAEHSIRIKEQYRICFVWGETGPVNVEITDYH